MEQVKDTKDENGVYIVIENEEKSSRQRYKRQSIKVLSTLHFVCGAVAFLVETIKMFLTLDTKNDEPIIALGEGFYCGFIFLVTGLLGILSLKRTNSCKISAFLVMSVFSSLFGVFLFMVSLCVLPRPYIRDHGPGIVLHSILIICGFFELVLGIVSSAFGCHACCICCGGGSSEGMGNSVVYIASPGEAEVGKPRVVHLNMDELRKTKTHIGDKQMVLTKKEGTQDNKEEEIENNSTSYARFR